MRIRPLASLLLGAGAITAAVLGAGVAHGQDSRGPDISPGKGKKGGTLNVQIAETFEHLDPGQSFFQVDYVVDYAVHKMLYSHKPNDSTHLTPDLAAGQPKVSDGGKRVTIKIKPNVRYGGPIDRTVTSADVKYAIERAFSAVAPAGYATAYFGQIVGAPTKLPKQPKNISGIQVPDKTTIVFRLKSAFGPTMIKALSLPMTAPVPEDYAKPLDAKNPSTYDSDPSKQAFTGPYMITKYSSKGLTLVRNPNWKASTDHRPAYADKIVIKTGGDTAVVAKQVLASDNGLMIDGPTPEIIKSAYQRTPKQIAFVPFGNRYVGLNTKKGLTKNINVRKAIIAITDKVGMNLVRGGALVGVPGTHFLTPDQPGFAAAGGNKGFGLDYMDTPRGNLKIAEKYMKKAGFKSGKYSGNETIEIVGSKESPALESTQVFVNSIRKLGFKTKLVSVPHATMYSKFCNVPKAQPEICPNVGWLPDFPDGYANFFVTFDGDSIPAANNSNWSQLDVPSIDKAIDKATATTNAAARNKAWAKVDRMVTEQAPVVMYQWSKDAIVEGKKVHGVVDTWNAAWNLSYSYLT